MITHLVAAEATKLIRGSDIRVAPAAYRYRSLDEAWRDAWFA